ncbi:hypothetical protein [Nocardioides mangrovi]|uniref:Uncharacterized protein n=1 Tax=Nocardioides mangrovi TaxID=2874580 RepID=A0ABS7UHS2_9ACTN|nr:hypothetical protein [Nocardioides mangrovi]MBZ5740560.1 hypothetical protein [Nocardioides mangrovi]
MKIIAAFAVPVLAVGLGAVVASPASAHTPEFSASCDGVHVGATAYDAGMTNRWSVTIDGVTQTGTFGASFSEDFDVPQDGSTTTWSAYVEAQDGSYHGEDSGIVGPCGTPADVCSDLPGAQPPGTACTPPPDVVRDDSSSLAGCKVAFGGTSYGAGALTYDTEYTDTYVFDAATNAWNLVTDTTPTIANVVFTPWTVAQQVAHDCVDRSTRPGTKVTRHRSSHVVCADNEIVTTTVTTRTPYTYDAATNTWVPGKPVKHTTTTTKPARPGQCTGVSATHEVSTGASSTSGSLAGSAVTSAGSALPTAVDAGLAGVTPVSSATAGASATAGVSTQDGRVPALLLVMTGLAVAAGAFRLRRS